MIHMAVVLSVVVFTFGLLTCLELWWQIDDRKNLNWVQTQHCGGIYTIYILTDLHTIPYKKNMESDSVQLEEKWLNG